MCMFCKDRKEKEANSCWDTWSMTDRENILVVMVTALEVEAIFVRKMVHQVRTGIWIKWYKDDVFEGNLVSYRM